MIGKMPRFLFCVVFTLGLESTLGFQSNPRPQSVFVQSRLSVTTTSNAVSASGESTEESSAPSESKKNEVDFKAYGNGYKTVFSEIPYADCKPSMGSIPSDLKGSYFRTGPGKQENREPVDVHLSIQR